MAVNEPRKGGAVLAIVGRVAAPVIALLVGAAGMAVLLDSGTSNLPSAAPGSSAPPTLPHEKVVVSAPAFQTKPSRTHVARHAPPARTSAPPAQSSGTVKTQPVNRPVTRPRAGGEPSSKPPVHHGGGSGSGGTGSGGTGSGGTGSGSGSPTPTTTPPPQIATASACTHPRGLALGHLKQSNGLALGHQDKPCRSRMNVPPGLAVGHRDHVPPGQARKAQNHQGDNGEDRNGDDEEDDQGSSDRGNGKDHGNGNGNGHGSHGHDHGG